MVATIKKLARIQLRFIGLFNRNFGDGFGLNQDNIFGLPAVEIVLLFMTTRALKKRRLIHRSVLNSRRVGKPETEKRPADAVLKYE